jgi:hypothetical protein
MMVIKGDRMGWFYEVLTVIAFSSRIQWTLLIGMLGFVALNIMGLYQLADFELHGAMAPLTEAIKNIMYDRYDNAAYGILFGSWWTAYKFYKKDKKRIFGSY